MENLKEVLEKINTININANTNVDIQEIVRQFVIFDAVKFIGVTFLIVGGFLVVAFLFYKATQKNEKMHIYKKTLEDMKELHENFKGDYRTAVEIKESLQEIKEYMPKNKKRRKF